MSGSGSAQPTSAECNTQCRNGREKWENPPRNVVWVSNLVPMAFYFALCSQLTHDGFLVPCASQCAHLPFIFGKHINWTNSNVPQCHAPRVFAVAFGRIQFEGRSQCSRRSRNSYNFIAFDFHKELVGALCSLLPAVVHAFCIRLFAHEKMLNADSGWFS